MQGHLFFRLLVSLAAILPLSGLLFHALTPLPQSEIWEHVRSTLLAEYLGNTLRLTAAVACGTLALGMLPAWIITAYRFPGRGILKWLLICPLAIPAYVMAYVYSGLLDVAGPIQGWLTEHLDTYTPRALYSPLQASAATLSLALFPYVYLLARAGFAQQSASMLETVRTLGCGYPTALLRVVLPLARPAIAAGLLLALMETLADYGTVQHFGLPVLTTGIFRAWEGFGDAGTAVRLATLLLGLATLLFALERLSRRQARYHQTGASPPRIRLRGTQAAAALVVCALPALLGFVLPVITLCGWALASAVPTGLQAALTNSMLLALAAALLALGAALLLLPMPGRARKHADTGRHISLLLVRLGYAVPGAVIAISILILMAGLQQQAEILWTWATGYSIPLLLTGSVVALIYAYWVRFTAIAVQAVEAGLARIPPALGEAGLSLGRSLYEVTWHVHLPLIRGSLLAALLMVFVEVLRELPATLLLRPFNFSTLAVRTYELAGEGRIADASWPALAIVGGALVPVLLLSGTLDHVRNTRS